MAEDLGPASRLSTLLDLISAKFLKIRRIKSVEIRERTFVSFVPDWSKEIGGGWKVRNKIERGRGGGGGNHLKNIKRLS